MRVRKQYGARAGRGRQELFTVSVTCVALLMAGCGADDAAHPGTDDTSKSLLAMAPLPEAPSSEAPVNGATPPSAGETRQEAAAGSVDLAELGFDFGDDSALVRVVEFSDFGCGYCRKFHMDTWPTLKKEFVETGKVQWKYVPFILGIFPHALEAAEAGECAGEQGKFTEMSIRLFKDQPVWKKSSKPEEVFRRFAEEENLDTKRFRQCVEEGWRTKRIQAGSALGRKAGVRGTPTFFVVGYAPLQGALDVDTFRKILNLVYEDHLKRRKGAGSNEGERDTP